MAKKFKIISLILLVTVLGLAIFRFVWIPMSYTHHLMGLRKALQENVALLDEDNYNPQLSTSVSLATLSSFDLEEIGQSIYNKAIPKNNFYTHYEGLKHLKDWGYSPKKIEHELNFALDACEQLLQLTMLIDNYRVLKAVLPSDELVPLQMGVITEGTSKQFYLGYANRESIQKLSAEDWNWNEKNYDEQLSDAQKKMANGVLPCKLWNRYILFYTQETNDNFWVQYCRQCASRLNTL